VRARKTTGLVVRIEYVDFPSCDSRPVLYDRAPEVATIGFDCDRNRLLLADLQVGEEDRDVVLLGW
jgi:hypothetical protein